jgi:hypothetical protein
MIAGVDPGVDLADQETAAAAGGVPPAPRNSPPPRCQPDPQAPQAREPRGDRSAGIRSAPDPDLGQARVATGADGTLLGIRKPLAAHEQPIVRTYVAVEDIKQAVKTAEEYGATIAYPPTRQGKRGTFAIVIQGGLEHGLWQR